MKKIAEDDVQKLTDAFVKDIDEKASLKEKEIMKV
jgi:ribosome recycling factor